MAEGSSRAVPQGYARTCGALYLYVVFAGSFAGVVVRPRLIVPGDAATTAANLAANELLFRVAFTGELLHVACDVAIATLLYLLFRPVDRGVALLAAFMRVACDVVFATASLSHFAALRLLGGADYLQVFEPGQLQALALLALRLHADAYAICLLFFAFACLALGYLILRADFLPRLLGVLLALAGGCYLVNSVAYFVAPQVADALVPWVFLPVFVAEAGLALWLLVKGVDVARWTARARATAA